LERLRLGDGNLMSSGGTIGRLLARFGPIMLALPGIVFIVLFFVVPVGVILIQSVLDHGLTLAFYRRLFSAPEYLTVFSISFKIALITTVISMLLSYPVAYMLVVASPLVRAAMLTVILLPFWTNVLIRCYAWMLMLQKGGVLNELLVNWLHVLTAPLALVFNLTGVIIGMVHYVVPINILVLFSIMKAIDLRLLQAAKGLGANPIRAFAAVFVPLSMPGVRAAAMLIFVISLGFYVTPALLGGRREITVAMLVSTYFSDVLNWGFGSALAAVLLVLSLIGLSLYFAFQLRPARVTQT
jgi:putative spermidine/putrescine transport system permease protein